MIALRNVLDLTTSSTSIQGIFLPSSSLTNFMSLFDAKDSVLWKQEDGLQNAVCTFFGLIS